MAYRKSYYRKDGTFVSASYDNRNNQTFNNVNSNKTNAIIAFLVFFFVLFFIIKCDNYIKKNREENAKRELERLLNR